MKTITVTEENYESILAKIQQICNKYKMVRFKRVLKEDGTEEREYRNNGMGFRKDYKPILKKNGECEYKPKTKFYVNDRYLRVAEHHFRKAFVNEPDSYDAKYMYPKMKSLIHINLSGGCALVIGVGDRVKFCPFGAFTVYTDNDFTRFESPLTIYKEAFIPNIFTGKISDLDSENHKRDKEWEAEEQWLDAEMEKNMEEDCEY